MLKAKTPADQHFYNATVHIHQVCCHLHLPLRGVGGASLAELHALGISVCPRSTFCR